MFGIQLNNRFLDLYPKTSLSFELNNSAYLGDDIDVIQNAFMFTVKVPMTDRNRRILINPDRVDNAYYFLTNEECGVWCEGLEVFRGLLSVRSATPKEADISLTVNTLSQLKDLMLSELPHDSFDLTAQSDPLGFLGGSCFSANIRDFICFPIWNPDFYATAEQSVEFSDANYQNLWGSHPSAVSKLRLANKSSITPFLKISYLLRKMAEATNFSISNSWQIDRELQQLCAYNNHSIAKWTADGTSYILDDKLELKNHVSKTKASDFLKNLSRLFNLGIYVNFFDKSLDIVPNKIILEQSARHDWSKKVVSDKTITESINYPSRFGFAEKTPSVLPDISKMNQYPYPSTLGNDPEGLYINTINRRYYHKPDSIHPEYIATELNNYVQFGSIEKNSYESPLSTLPNARIFINGFGTATAPGIRQKGSYKIQNGEESTASFEDRLLFYRGLADFRTANGATNPFFALTYPLASAEDFTVEGYRIKTGWDSSQLSSNITPPQYAPEDVKYSLNWNGSKGLYAQWWATWHEMLQRKRDVKLSIALSTKDIRAFRFQDKVRIQNKEYIVKKLRITLTEFGAATTEAELVTVIE